MSDDKRIANAYSAGREDAQLAMLDELDDVGRGTRELEEVIDRIAGELRVRAADPINDDEIDDDEIDDEPDDSDDHDGEDDEDDLPIQLIPIRDDGLAVMVIVHPDQVVVALVKPGVEQLPNENGGVVDQIGVCFGCTAKDGERLHLMDEHGEPRTTHPVKSRRRRRRRR
jgi:hypothetical protein